MKKILKRGAAALLGVITMLSVPSGISLNKNTPTVEAASDKILAFPGAVGGGKYSTGGRGGEVYHVTNLNDSGTGSFRDAVSKSNRIVVFDVSGTIELKSNILCQSNVTIAGQTAPGGSGITLKNYKMGMSGDNIICRYISSRPGPYASTSSGNDAWGGAAGSNSIIDHCSMGWTTDEQWGLYSNNMNYTVQYSVIGPADSWGGHKKGLHGFGLMMGKGNLTFDHNLIIHNVSRNFRGKVQGTYTADFTNNIIYDWGYQTAYGTIGHLNYVNNTLKAGNSTTGGYHWMNVDSSTSPENFKVYCDGNRLINKDGSLHDITNDNWSGVSVKTSIGITKDDLYSSTPFQTIINGTDVSSVNDVESAEASYEHVVSFAGNGIAPEKRTAIDRQCADETKNGTGSCSGTSDYDSTQTDLDKYNIQCGVTYEYPSAVLTKTITDTDNDGMPDEWELARGLDPNDASDTNGDYCGQGYTNIEYYINDLTVDSFPEGVVTLSPETTQVEPVSAFETIEAENFDEQSGVKTEDCSEGGQNIGYIENGDYVMFRNVDFEDGAKSFIARVAGGQEGCAIEVYVDSLDGTPIAKCSIPSTGGWQDWTDVSCNTAAVTGKHTLYLKFTGGEGYLFNINNFVFGREAIPLNGKLINNLIVNDSENSADWSISEGMANGSLIYGDRNFTALNLPAELDGAEYIKTACDSKNYTDTLGTFTAGADISIYTALDTRVNPVPDWLSQWEKTSLSFISSNDVTFELYKKSVKEGETVTLGSNGQSANCVNYIVLAMTEKEMVKGDVNADGVFDVADVVMMQKWLLCAGELTDWKAGDLYGDNMINAFDLCLMKQMLKESIS
ncbi:carbohydrate-binding protein [uncultured Ruminococcus sp.]|uniref:carbohydrate-binding protein n=1 Tax=uncultured Ruminococcus sp. TaxID=165186 RepID=UPI002627059D|nr:carbohydrate-binding protein [uncultured Ruminococcus sp.]